MKTQLRIDNRGRITIPEVIRETLDFKDIAYLEIKDNKIILSKNFNPIAMIDDMLNNVSQCEDGLKYIDILYEAKNKMEEKCKK